MSLDTDARIMTGFCMDCGSQMSPVTLVCRRCFDARVEQHGSATEAFRALVADHRQRSEPEELHLSPRHERRRT